jgi:hypothetical protein
MRFEGGSDFIKCRRYACIIIAMRIFKTQSPYTAHDSPHALACEAPRQQPFRLPIPILNFAFLGVILVPPPPPQARIKGVSKENADL